MSPFTYGALNSPTKVDEFVRGYSIGYYECGGDISPTDGGFALWEEATPNTEDDSVEAPLESSEKQSNTQPSLRSDYDQGYELGCYNTQQLIKRVQNILKDAITSYFLE